jgi:signal transduction histidine kinase
MNEPGPTADTQSLLDGYRRLEAALTEVDTDARFREEFHRFGDDLARFVRQRDIMVLREFLVSLSHDLRAPVGALVHQAELLTTPDVSEHVKQRSRAALAENAAVLSRMLGTLVEIERLALGELTLDPAPTSVQSLVEHVIDGDGGPGPAVRGELPSGTVEVSVDSAAMQRTLRTIVSDVCERSGTATVEVGARLGGDDVIVHVAAPTQPEVPVGVNPVGDHIEMRLARTIIDLHGGRIHSGPGFGVEISLPRVP